MDTFKHKGLRKQLVEEIREKGITSEAVLEAINNVPRHQFLDNVFINFAYEDKAFPIGEGQTISHPYTVAFQSQLLNVKRGDKILEIGTGSGYQTCVLLQLGAKVFTIERQKALFTKTKGLLANMGQKAKCFYGDGYKGLPAFAPFDKILVTAGAPYVPEDLKDQVKIGGMLVVPVGGDDSQKMISLIKIDENNFEEVEHGDFKFVPFLKEKV